MNHNLTLPASDYNAMAGHLITKHNPLYATGDKLTVTLEGQREQKEFIIKTIITEHVHKDWCVLLLATEAGIVDLTGKGGSFDEDLKVKI